MSGSTHNISYYNIIIFDEVCIIPMCYMQIIFTRIQDPECVSLKTFCEIKC